MRGVGVGRDLSGAFDGSIASAQTRVVDARARGYGKDVVEMRIESLARSGTRASSAASQTSRKLLNTMLGSGALAVPGCFRRVWVDTDGGGGVVGVLSVRRCRCRL